MVQSAVQKPSDDFLSRLEAFLVHVYQGPPHDPRTGREGGLLRWNGRSEGYVWSSAVTFKLIGVGKRRVEVDYVQKKSGIFLALCDADKTPGQKLPCWALMSNLRYLFATAWGVSRCISNDAKHHSTG